MADTLTAPMFGDVPGARRSGRERRTTTRMPQFEELTDVPSQASTSSSAPSFAVEISPPKKRAKKKRSPSPVDEPQPPSHQMQLFPAATPNPNPPSEQTRQVGTSVAQISESLSGFSGGVPLVSFYASNKMDRPVNNMTGDESNIQQTSQLTHSTAARPTGSATSSLSSAAGSPPSRSNNSDDETTPSTEITDDSHGNATGPSSKDSAVVEHEDATAPETTREYYRDTDSRRKWDRCAGLHIVGPAERAKSHSRKRKLNSARPLIVDVFCPSTSLLSLTLKHSLVEGRIVTPQSITRRHSSSVYSYTFDHTLESHFSIEIASPDADLPVEVCSPFLDEDEWSRDAGAASKTSGQLTTKRWTLVLGDGKGTWRL